MNQPPPSPLLDPHSYAERLKALRAAIAQSGLDGYLVPMTDAYQNEYIAPPDRRIKYLCGFSGTAGFIIVLDDRAAFFTDGRYTLQAQEQLPEGLYELCDIARTQPSEWLAMNLREHMKLGFDPCLHTAKQIESLEFVALRSNASLVPLEHNLIDAIWSDKPEPLIAPFYLHNLEFAGKSANEKRQDTAAALLAKKLDAAVLTDPASVAWLMNVRGNDVPFTPLPLSTLILRADGSVEWFADPRKVNRELESALGSGVRRLSPADFPAALKRLGEMRSQVLVDPSKTSYHTISLLRQAGALLTAEDDPCALPRACKNKTEIEGARNAHRRDAAAVIRFLSWLDTHPDPSSLTEMDIDEKLTSLREVGTHYRGRSFATIAASGPNGAIVHYRPKPETTRNLDNGSFLLLDSGAQYLDGTTDITRTICLGSPTDEMKNLYTRVLKGHIAIAALRFPEGTSGADIDVLARASLWSLGLDYAHGTGHGVGSYLSVHEGPQSISRRGTTPLMAGMITSNEPGYYKARHFGIRLENLQFVTELYEMSSPSRRMFGFEQLTLVPFDCRAIEPALLTREEKDWLNTYHARVLKAIRPQLDEATGQWLSRATQPIE